MSFWMAYVAVPDCDATVTKAQRLGGKVPMPAMDIPDVGRFATILDPQMAAIAILQPKPPQK
jgi:predicted enzyme related to lactoylglutathione lyase